MLYTQRVLALDGVVVPTPESTLFIATYPADGGGWVATQRHTFTPSGRRLSDDLWDEYRFECAMRDRMQLPEVRLAEFRDMRDWTDGIEETNDNWITKPGIDASPYGCVANR